MLTISLLYISKLKNIPKTNISCESCRKKIKITDSEIIEKVIFKNVSHFFATCPINSYLKAGYRPRLFNKVQQSFLTFLGARPIPIAVLVFVASKILRYRTLYEFEVKMEYSHKLNILHLATLLIVTTIKINSWLRR